MNPSWNEQQRRELAKRGLSHRNFGRIAAIVTAGATLPFYNESAMAQLSAIRGPMPADAVKINANENPLGPCPEAWRQSRRSRVMAADTFTRRRSGFRNYWQQEGLKPDYVQPYAGSSAPLHQAVLAFCSPVRPFVTSDPGYEAGRDTAGSVLAVNALVAVAIGCSMYALRNLYGQRVKAIKSNI